MNPKQSNVEMKPRFFNHSLNRAETSPKSKTATENFEANPERKPKLILKPTQNQS